MNWYQTGSRLEVTYEEYLGGNSKFYIDIIKRTVMTCAYSYENGTGTGKDNSSAVWYGNETISSICKGWHTIRR